MYDYNSVTPESCNADRFPNDEIQNIFFQSYLECSKEDTPIERLKEEMRPHICSASLIWILWGIIQNAVSTVDFNYELYSVERIEYYYQKKKEIFGVESLPLYDPSKVHNK